MLILSLGFFVLLFNSRHRCVQDLSWVIGSPPVISGRFTGVTWLDRHWCARELEACLPLLRQLEQDPEPLQQRIKALKSRRLGEYFECLVGFWLEHSPNCRLLYQNRQIRDGKRTLGEMDFIFDYLPSGKIIHLEVAVKFYLGVDNLQDMSNWHGPGLLDRLDEKYQHLIAHQTQLPQKHPELMPVTVTESWCLFKGRMFYPASAVVEASFFAEGHPRGYWQIESQALSQGGSEFWLPLHKSEWLSEFHNIGKTEHGRLRNQRKTGPYPRSYALIVGNQEGSRMFLLADDFWRAKG